MFFRFKGKVVHGQKLGRKIGFRTANIPLNIGNIDGGTYKINGVLGKKILRGVGTFMESKEIFEAHFFDFDKNIYGKEVEIIVLKKIRDNKKFENFQKLKKQIVDDIKIAKKNKIIGCTFGTFDIVHTGHKYYLGEAKKYCDILITVVARDKNVIQLKGALPLHPETKRIESIKKLNISDKVLLGDKSNPLKWIIQYRPEVICLGYDQLGFSNFLKDIKFPTEIIRIQPYKQEIYKSSLIKHKKLAK